VAAGADRRADAERLVAEGARVVIADIDESNGRALADKLGAEFHKLDVSDPDDWAELVAAVTASLGGIDIAYLNAGITTYPVTDGGLAPFDIATLDLDAYRRISGVNIDGVVLGARAVAPAIAARGGGAIVATASVAGLIGFAPDPIYTMAKHGVVGFVRALAPTLVERKITVNAICPGGVETNILGPGIAERSREAGIPLMPPSQIADAVVKAIESGETGRLYVCLHGRDHQIHRPAPVEGLGPG
jgi:NAD(P)-dependent dehydrogenase (short-subunit alcohol dehydrogenase family)